MQFSLYFDSIGDILAIKFLCLFRAIDYLSQNTDSWSNGESSVTTQRFLQITAECKNGVNCHVIYNNELHVGLLNKEPNFGQWVVGDFKVTNWPYCGQMDVIVPFFFKKLYDIAIV